MKEAFEFEGSGNCLMLSPDIQKELAKCCAHEVTQVIKDEIGDRNFAVLIDESRDSSIKEQMSVIVRLVVHIMFFSLIIYDLCIVVLF